MALELVTKDDLKEFVTKKDLADVKTELKQNIEDLREDLADVRVELITRIDEKASSTLSLMLAAMDELRHDIVGAFKDEISSIKGRLNKLEGRA